MCRRTDVGLGNVRIPGSRRRYHRADTLLLEYAIGRINPNRAAHRSRAVTEWSAGALEVASEPLLITITTAAPATGQRPANSGNSPGCGANEHCNVDLATSTCGQVSQRVDDGRHVYSPNPH